MNKLRIYKKIIIEKINVIVYVLKFNRVIRYKKEVSKKIKMKNDKIRLKRRVRNNMNGLTKLHIGCGPRVLKDWINIDLAFEPYQNYLKYYKDKHYGSKVRGTKKDFFAINVTKSPLPLLDSTVDVVFHEDFIEHLDQKEQFLFLAEVHRILKPGGVHRINTPNLVSSMRDYSDFSLGFSGVHVQEWEKHVHKSVLTPKTLKEYAKIIGYSKVNILKRNKSTAVDIPSEYRPDPNDRPEDGNIFADLIK